MKDIMGRRTREINKRGKKKERDREREREPVSVRILPFAMCL